MLATAKVELARTAIRLLRKNFRSWSEMELRTFLAAHRGFLGQIAERTGKDPSTVSRVIRGSVRNSPEVIDAIEDGLAELRLLIDGASKRRKKRSTTVAA